MCREYVYDFFNYYMYVLVYVLFMCEFVWIDILGMGWGIFWDYGEIEIKFNRYIGICMFKVLGIG